MNRVGASLDFSRDGDRLRRQPLTSPLQRFNAQPRKRHGHEGADVDAHHGRGRFRRRTNDGIPEAGKQANPAARARTRRSEERRARRHKRRPRRRVVASLVRVSPCVDIRLPRMEPIPLTQASRESTSHRARRDRHRRRRARVDRAGPCSHSSHRGLFNASSSGCERAARCASTSSGISSARRLVRDRWRGRCRRRPSSCALCVLDRSCCAQRKPRGLRSRTAGPRRSA